MFLKILQQIYACSVQEMKFSIKDYLCLEMITFENVIFQAQFKEKVFFMEKPCSLLVIFKSAYFKSFHQLKF